MVWHPLKKKKRTKKEKEKKSTAEWDLLFVCLMKLNIIPVVSVMTFKSEKKKFLFKIVKTDWSFA